jgi:hypothetical protein
MNKISKRLHIPYCRVRKIINNKECDATIAFQKYKPRNKFKKIHEISHNKIIDIF